MTINLAPIISYTICLILIIISTLMTLSQSTIIEWEIYSILSRSLKISLILEWRRIIYSSVIIFISGRVLKFSKIYIKHDLNKLRFTYILLLFILSINLLIFIPNIICLLIGWDGLGITSFILIIHYNNRRSLSAGILTILTNRLGDAFLLIAIIRTLDSRNWLTQNPQTNFSTFQWIGITIAAITKRAQIPYSRWLPAAIAAPTPVSALVHSSTLVTAGVFLLYRFYDIIASSKIIQLILIIRGLSTAILAGIRATYENDIKKIIALSTLSQLGIITICLGAKLPNLALFHIISHAIFKALLFIAAGTIISLNLHNQDLRLYGQFLNLSPITTSSLIISRIALMGIPFITGYYSKHAILRLCPRSYINYLIYILLLLAIILTSLYTSRLIIFTIINPSIQQTMYCHSSYSNYSIPLTSISIISTTAGRTIQWIIPVIPVESLITENFEPYLINLIIGTGIIFLTTKIIMSPITSSQLYLNKFYSSLNFLVPVSTQLILPIWISISTKLFKYLDQTWLEKISSLGLPLTINIISSHLNTLLQYQQKLLFNLSTTIVVITFIFYTITF